MTEYVIPVPPQSSIAIHGESARFPVRRVYCIGRNYVEHAREMGLDPDRDPPIFFQKPADTIEDDGARIPYPPETRNFHHEIELVMAIDKGGRDIAVEDALAHVFGYAVGIDLTRRDLQLAARDTGRPWSWGKAFDRSAPCAPLRRVSEVGHVNSGRIWLTVNGAVRQNADISELIWSPAEMVSAISRSMLLQPGDIIFTGTPAGVGPLVAGDHVVGGVDGLGEITIDIL